MRGEPRLVVGGIAKQNGKYLLTKEVLENKKEYWILPGGGVEFGESLEEAVKREMKEELGLNVSVQNFLGFKEAIFPKYNYHTLIFFYALKPKNKLPRPLEKKILDARYFSPKEIKKLNLVESAAWIFRRMKLL